MTRLALATYYLAITALGGIVCTASSPDFYLFGLAPLAIAVAAWKSMSNPASRKLFLRIFVAVGLISLVIGRFFYEDHQLTDRGIVLVLILGAVPALASTLWIYSYEKQWLKGGSQAP